MLYDYVDDTHTHKFKAGEIIQPVGPDQGGWLPVLRNNGETVYFPTDYGEPVNKDRARVLVPIDPLTVSPAVAVSRTSFSASMDASRSARNRTASLRSSLVFASDDGDNDLRPPRPSQWIEKMKLANNNNVNNDDSGTLAAALLNELALVTGESLTKTNYTANNNNSNNDTNNTQSTSTTNVANIDTSTAPEKPGELKKEFSLQVLFMKNNCFECLFTTICSSILKIGIQSLG